MEYKGNRGRLSSNLVDNWLMQKVRIKVIRKPESNRWQMTSSIVVIHQLRSHEKSEKACEEVDKADLKRFSFFQATNLWDDNENTPSCRRWIPRRRLAVRERTPNYHYLALCMDQLMKPGQRVLLGRECVCVVYVWQFSMCTQHSISKSAWISQFLKWRSIHSIVHCSSSILFVLDE